MESRANLTVRWAGLGSLLLLIAGLVRWRASLNEFWFDEVWSWIVVQQYVHSGADVVLSLKHEINHFMNSWFIYMLGPGCSWTTYRLPSVLLGTATVGLAGWWTRLSGRAAGGFALILTSGSYLLIHYSSEARGYAPMLFFSLLGLIALERTLQRSDWRSDLLWNLSAVLGVLAQPVFVSFFGSMVVWSGLRCWRAGKHGRAWWAAMLRWHAAPTAFCAFLYAVNLRHLVHGGGETGEPWTIVAQAASLAVGGPQQGVWMGVLAVVLGVVFLGVVYALNRKRVAGVAGGGARLGAENQRELGWLFALVVVVGPGALMVVVGRGDLYVRYFMLSVLFTLLLLSVALGWMWQSGGVRRVAAVLIVAAMLLGNAVHVKRLYDHGRGAYLAAFQLVQQQTRFKEVYVSVDHVFRYSRLLSFYRDYLDPQKQVVLLEERESAPWLIRSSFELDWQPPRQYSPAPTLQYELVQHFPYAGLSGWGVAVYRRAR